jgi:hypothetical protein
MIFDHKSVHEITDEEIDALVRNHLQERQHLEFKATVNLRSDDGKHELLKDVASMANGGGGYLIIGIRDDGKGRAQAYASDFKLDGERVKRSMTNLCHTYISQRIQGLEVQSRIVRSHPVVIVRVPASDDAPHMVTFHETTGFYNRYNDGKRSMTINEIKGAFSRYSLEQSGHDDAVFQESDEILGEAGLEILLEELEDNCACSREDCQVILDFYEFLKDGQKSYIHPDLRATCEALRGSFEQILVFLATNYYGPCEERGGQYHLSLCPDSGADLEIDELSAEDELKLAQLHQQLEEITEAIRTNYEKYRRTVKKVLLL